MSIKVYNSLTRTKEEFKPKKAEQVSIYVCGVTVYDVCHLGHLRSALVFDVIRNYFKYRGYVVKFVKNITDVDDKIITKAQTLVFENKAQDLQSATREVAQKYTDLYHQDMASFGIQPPDIEPKATEHITEIQQLIQKLIDNGFAYESQGNVYFQVDKLSGYGKLSGRNPEQMQAGARIEPDQTKKTPMDFALWKTSKSEEPSWDSPWGKGRPGWHIECSAMSMKYLGENFDIHAGGLDLIFPHHENEIAQSEAASGRAFANYWLHNGMLTVGGEKMSKSLNNFITMQDLLKEYNPEEIKLFMLMTHYQSPLDFNKEELVKVRKALSRFYNLFDKIDGLIKKDEQPSAASQSSRKENESNLKDYRHHLEKFNKQINKYRLDFETAMDDNFNTARALASLFDLSSTTSTFLYNEDVPNNKKGCILRTAKLTLKTLGDILGLFREGSRPKQETADDPELRDKVHKLLEDVVAKLKKDAKFAPVSGFTVEKLPQSPDEELSLPETFLPDETKDLSLDSAVTALIDLRSQLRIQKQFDSADDIRDKLGQLGVILEDGRGRTTWSMSISK